MVRPHGWVKQQGASCGLYRSEGPGSQAGPFRFPPGLGGMGWGWARVPSRTLLVSVHFALLGEEIVAFALGSGVCAGVCGAWGGIVSPNVVSPGLNSSFHQTKRHCAIYIYIYIYIYIDIYIYIYIYIYTDKTSLRLIGRLRGGGRTLIEFPRMTLSSHRSHLVSQGPTWTHLDSL